MSVRINGTTGVTTPNLTATTKVTTADLANTGNYNGGQLGNRNIIINGEFDIDQRGLASSTAFQSGAHYVTDRWSYYINSGAFATFSANHEISDEAPSGFTKSLKVTCTSGSSIPATGEVIYRQKIEGYNIKRLGYGTPSAKSLTLSFWIKASVTGDYGVQLIYEADDSANKYYVSKYTVNSANTWEYKTITIPPNTADAFKYTTTGLGAQIYWDLGEGSTYSGTADSGWTNTYYNGLSGGVKLMENTGATWQKTGVQLEVGDTATPFEHRSYGDELAKCQRYYEKIFLDDQYRLNGVAWSTESQNISLPFTVTKRVPPSISISSIGQVFTGSWVTPTSSEVTGATINGGTINIRKTGSYTVKYGYFIRNQDFRVDAEL